MRSHNPPQHSQYFSSSLLFFGLFSWVTPWLLVLSAKKPCTNPRLLAEIGAGLVSVYDGLLDLFSC